MAYSPPPTSNLTHYLTLTEAAELGYGAYSTLRSWIAKGKLPSYKTGTRVKLQRSGVVRKLLTVCLCGFCPGRLV